MGRHLIQAANYIVGPFGEDCALRRWALARLEAGEKRKKVIIAVARKLAVLMHHLWLTGTIYEPLYQGNKTSGQSEVVAMAA